MKRLSIARNSQNKPLTRFYWTNVPLASSCDSLALAFLSVIFLSSLFCRFFALPKTGSLEIEIPMLGQDVDHASKRQRAEEHSHTNHDQNDIRNCSAVSVCWDGNHGCWTASIQLPSGKPHHVRPQPDFVWKLLTTEQLGTFQSDSTAYDRCHQARELFIAKGGQVLVVEYVKQNLHFARHMEEHSTQAISRPKNDRTRSTGSYRGT